MGFRLDDMEYLLHRIQQSLTTLRVEYDAQTARNLSLERQLRSTRLSLTRFCAKKERLEATNTALHIRL